MTDIEVIRRVRGGNIAAYEELVIKYEKRLYGTILTMIGDEQDSLDLLQNVFLKAYSHIGDFNEESEYFTYLYRIAVNECKDFWKKSKKNRQVSLYDEEGNPLDIESKKDIPEDETVSNDIIRAVNEEIDKLPDGIKEIVILKSTYGYSYDEIARIMNIDVGTVKSRLHRGREKLRNVLKERNIL